MDCTPPLGDQTTQEEAIDLDPYSVFANGNLSLLTTPSKRRLLKALSNLVESDFFFQRHDSWRRFNVTGFFTNDVADELAEILSAPNNGSQLRDLMLRQIHGTPVVGKVSSVLRNLMLEPKNDYHTRLLAHWNLAPLAGYDHRADFHQLLKEATRASLTVACDLLAYIGIGSLDKAVVVQLFRACGTQYAPQSMRDRSYELRDAIKRVIATFDLAQVTGL